jgi:hypothetical protein
MKIIVLNFLKINTMSPEDKNIPGTYAKSIILCGLFYWPVNLDVGVHKMPFYILSWIIIIISISAYAIFYWELNWKKILLNGSLALVGVALVKILIDSIIYRTNHDLILLELMIVFICGLLISGLGVVIGAALKEAFELPPE